MDMEILSRFFLWCAILNLSMVSLSFLIAAGAGDFVYRLHSRWFPMPRETFNAIFYSFIGGYKILTFVFNVIPWIALTIVRASLP
ncbi:MAG: hypothetical protein GXY54_10865 [Deltaproteobacteria bacterium]|nr:hypothetical protein [Deltaproteobacteria bacterium]